MFADDTAFVAHNYQSAQDIISCFSKSAKHLGWKLTTKKKILQGSHDLAKTESQVLTEINKIQISKLHTRQQ